MNSEQQTQIDKIAAEALNQNTVNPVMQRGLDYEALVQMPAYRQLITDLKEVFQGLILTLRKAKTLKDTTNIQNRLDNMEQVIYTLESKPKVYIEQAKLFIKERQKLWQKRPQPQRQHR